MVDLFRPFVAPEAAAAVAAVLTPDSDGRLYIGRGPLVDRFESELATLLETEGRPALALSSCTAAIDLALHLCGVSPRTLPGTQVVLSTPMTCAATNTPILSRGARILWADVDPVTGGIDPLDVARKVERFRHEAGPFDELKAIIAVDWAGRSCDYNALRAAAPGIPIIQDAAHSLLGTHNGRYFSKVGGDYTCYSFGPIKHLSMPNGGALVCPPGQDERARLLSWYGLDRRSGQDFRCAQDITEAGHKYILSDVDAAVGLANLPHVAELIWRHRANAAIYHHRLEGLPGLTLPPYDPGCSYWVYPFLTDDRDECIAFLAERGIAASQVHRRCDTHPAFVAATHPATGARPGLDSFAARQCNVPCGWWVSDADSERVIEALTEWAALHRDSDAPPATRPAFAEVAA